MSKRLKACVILAYIVMVVVNALANILPINVCGDRCRVGQLCESFCPGRVGVLYMGAYLLASCCLCNLSTRGWR